MSVLDIYECYFLSLSILNSLKFYTCTTSIMQIHVIIHKKFIQTVNFNSTC